MRAIEFTGYGPSAVARVTEVTEPHAGKGRIRIAVRASGVSPGEIRLRSGAMREIAPITFPYRSGFDAAGVVDEVGSDVAGTAIGDEVFGWPEFAARGANADFVVLAAWAPKPSSWSWEEAGGAAGAVETSVRVLDRLGVTAGDTVLVQGAAGGTGSVVVQFAVARGATVIGTASEGNHRFLRSLGVTPTTYGPGLAARIRELAPEGVDAVVDCAGGDLPDLVAIAGDADRVVTIADLGSAAHGVHLSSGMTDALAVSALAAAVDLADASRLRIPVAGAFALADVAAAHDLTETRHARGKVVLIH
ncbi:NADP-dependent oxidoreductase [Frondihabitans sucicola]|uniref:NADP-dependent oxidoreductase n=1 Tax=Frondihabitans sucicola TaxID=1268041 RepID=UPI0025745169|nr:NADP-dependent oxidoreductase [Frondihabitans sucicola]